MGLFGSRKKSAPPAIEKKTDSSHSKRASDGRLSIAMGTIFMIMGFMGTMGVLVLMLNAKSMGEARLKSINEQLILVKTEKDVVAGQVEQLKDEVGRVLDLSKIVDQSKKMHGDKEAARNTGVLWLDRKSSRMIVTLGILNGVNEGQYLSVYERDKKFARVKVATAMDVISYAQPTDKTIKDFLKDYYTVKVE